jgi:hypothetical protein
MYEIITSRTIKGSDYCMERGSLAELNKQWFSTVDEFKKSNLSQAEFCRVNKYNPRQFNYWYRKFKNSKTIEDVGQPERPKWVSVDIAASNNNDSLKVQIGSAKIDINPGFNKHLLLEVVEVLNRLC